MRVSYLLIISVFISFGFFDRGTSIHSLFPSTSQGEVYNYSYYSVSYAEEYEQAEWVAYHFSQRNASKSVDRTDDFREDPNIQTGTAKLSDYKGSGYDRGHLVPAGSMAFDPIAMSESFYLSNMSPQDPSFNRGIWKKLETQVRSWYNQKGDFIVISGGVLKPGLKEIGGSGVDVPDEYYKIVYDYDGENHDLIAFVLPNRKGEKNLSEYVVSVDYVESITGIDFFPALPDSLENSIESKIDKSKWNFNPSSTSNASSSTQSASVQCKGIAKSTGVQCKNKTLSENGYCHHHQSQDQSIIRTTTPTPKANYSGRCRARTQAGSQCKRTAASGSSFCWQHK